MASSIATNLVAFIIVLGFLIFAHESGHFLVAKLFRVRVLVFSFGFGKRLFGFKRGDTDYRVSLIPLGGYVRMAGDAAEEERAGADYEFLSKPKWQRFLILVAGPAMNVLIAIVFLMGLLMAGREVLRDSDAVIGSVLEGKAAAAAGLEPGDRIVRLGQERIDDWDDLRLAISMNPGVDLDVAYERDGVSRATRMTPERVETEYGMTGVAGITPFITTEVGRVLPDTAAARAGVQPGDVIVSAAGKEVTQLADLERILSEQRPVRKVGDKETFLPVDKPIAIEVRRGSSRIPLTLPPPAAEGEGWPGFVPPTELEKLGPADALRESLAQNWKMVRYTFAVLGRLFRAEGSMKDFSGPISIARISGEMLRTGWIAVIYLMATISLQLGIMNLLPIPVLDGGHIMILLVEGISGRELSLNTKERIFRIGFAFLAVLMIVVLYNDVIQNVMLMRKG